MSSDSSSDDGAVEGTIPYVAYLCGGGAKPGKGGNRDFPSELLVLRRGGSPTATTTTPFGPVAATPVDDPGTADADDGPGVGPTPAADVEDGPPPGVVGKKLDSGEGRPPPGGGGGNRVAVADWGFPPPPPYGFAEEGVGGY